MYHYFVMYNTFVNFNNRQYIMLFSCTLHVKFIYIAIIID